MKTECQRLIQTPGIFNEIHTENCMKQIAYAHFFDFIETLNNDLQKLQPLYEEDPQQFNGDLPVGNLNSLLETFDSSLDLFLNVFNADSNSAKNKISVFSSIFATMFTNYMQMTAELFSHDFPLYVILPYIGVYSSIEKIYVDILRCAQNGIESEEGGFNISRFKTAWNRHYSVFTNMPSLINYLDFPSYSQKLENVYQYTKNFSPDENTQQQIFTLITNLSYLLKSLKDKLLIINEKITKNQIQDLLNETASFHEYIQLIGLNQLNGFHMSTLYSLISSLEHTKSILNIHEYLERLNKIIQQDDFTIDIADFATSDVQLVMIKHIMQTMVSEFNCMIHFSQKSTSLSTKRMAQSLYQSVKSDNFDLTEKYEKLAEIITPLVPQSDIEYENVFMSTMSNIRSPEVIFESFKNTMKKVPKTIDDHCARLVSFVEFETAAHLNLNQSNDIIKFKEYLVYNIISAKIQEIIPILEDQVFRVEGNLYNLSSTSKMSQISSYCQSIILHLHQMAAQKIAPKKVRCFSKMFVLSMEFIEMIIKRGSDYHSFVQLIQNISFPPPDLLIRNFKSPDFINRLRLLISKIQMCQLSIGKTTISFLDKFSRNKGNEDNNSQADRSNGQFILDDKDIFSDQISIFDRCDEYIREVFLLLHSFKTYSRFCSIYSKFYELCCLSPSLFKVIQKMSSNFDPVLSKHIPIFIRCFIALLKRDKKRKPFLSINLPLFDLYATILIFLKSIYTNESIDLSVLFLHILDSIPIINFCRYLSKFILDINQIEVIILSSKSYDNLEDILKNYRNCISSIVKEILFNDNFNIEQLNEQIDIFLASLFYTSPKIFAQVEEIFNSITYFLRHLDYVKSLIDSVSRLTSFFKLSTQTFCIKYSDIILRNFVLACTKAIKKISKGDFLSFEITDYLSSFASKVNNSFPRRAFEKIDEYHIATILQSILNLFSSSASFYQASAFPLYISSILPPPPPVTFPSSQSNLLSSTISSSSSTSNLNQNMNSFDQNSDQPQSTLSLPSLPVYSLWFMNNFNFIEKVQPILACLSSIVANSDENPENMKIIIKMNQIVKNFNNIFNPKSFPSNEPENDDDDDDRNEDQIESTNQDENSFFDEFENYDCSHLYLSKFSLVYKLKRLMEKINFEGQISQCQFIDCYNQLDSLINTEINILHLNRTLLLANFFLFGQLQSQCQIIRAFKFTKTINWNECLKKDLKDEIYTENSSLKSSNNDEYDEYDELDKSEENPEAADYEEEVEETENTTEQKQETDETKTENDEIESEKIKEVEEIGKQDQEVEPEPEPEAEAEADEDDEQDYEEDHDDAENRKEEEDQEYGEEHEYGDYDYDDYSELRARSSISPNFRLSSLGGFSSTNENIDDLLYSTTASAASIASNSSSISGNANNGNSFGYKNKNFFDFSFARKADLDGRYIDILRKGKYRYERDFEAIDNSSSSMIDGLSSFPCFYPNGFSTSICNDEGDLVDDFSFDRPIRFQLDEIIEKSEVMTSEIRKLIEKSNLWMHGSPRDALIPLIPLSDAVSEVNRELHSTVESIYGQISTFDQSNSDVIAEAKKWLEKSAARQGTVRTKQKELLAKTREYARMKNVLTYSYSLAIRKFEKLKSENLKKKIELQQLTSKLRLAQMMNNFSNIDENESDFTPSERKTKNSSFENDEIDDDDDGEEIDDDDDGEVDGFNGQSNSVGRYDSSDSDSEMNDNPLRSSSSIRSDSIDSLKKFSQYGQSFVVEPFVPVRIVTNIGTAPADAEAAELALSEEIIKNERLKSLLRSSNLILKNQRMQQYKQSNNNSNSANTNSTSNSSNNNSNDDKEGITNNSISSVDSAKKKDVIDQYFGQIALIRSLSENLDKPISSEVNVDEAGEELIRAISEFRKNSTESRKIYRTASKELLKKLDKMISIYGVQKKRTNKIRSLIRAAKVTKEDYKTALSKLLEDEI